MKRLKDEKNLGYEKFENFTYESSDYTLTTWDASIRNQENNENTHLPVDITFKLKIICGENYPIEAPTVFFTESSDLIAKELSVFVETDFTKVWNKDWSI